MGEPSGMPRRFSRASAVRAGPAPPLPGSPPWTGRVLRRWEVGFEERLQHQHCCWHAGPIPHGRDAQRPELAVGLRDKHSSDRIRLVTLLPERKRQFAEPALYAIRLNVREVLTV